MCTARCSPSTRTPRSDSSTTAGCGSFELRPGRAVVNLLLTRFIDCDLGQYNEFSFCAMVQPPGSRCSRAAGVRHGRHIRAPHDGRRGIHAGGGQTDLGIPEGDGGLHRSRRQSVRVRCQRRRIARRRDGDRPRAARADAVASAVAAHLHQPRRQDPRDGRRTAVVGITRPPRRRHHQARRSPDTPRSSHRSGCPSKRSACYVDRQRRHDVRRRTA